MVVTTRAAAVAEQPGRMEMVVQVATLTLRKVVVVEAVTEVLRVVHQRGVQVLMVELGG